MYVTSSLVRIKKLVHSAAVLWISFLPTYSPSQVDPAGLVHRHMGPTTYPFVFLYFVQSFVLFLQRLAVMSRTPRWPIIAYGIGQAIPLLPHIVRRRQLHRPTLHPNKSTLVLPSACVFPRSGSIGPRSRRRPPPWCSRRGAAVCRSQHGQQNKRNRETTVRREADSPGPTRSMA